MKKYSKILCKLVPSIVAFSVVSPISSAMFNDNSLSSCKTMASSNLRSDLVPIVGLYEINCYSNSKSVEYLDGYSMSYVSASIRIMAETLHDKIVYNDYIYMEKAFSSLNEPPTGEMMNLLNKIRIDDLCNEEKCTDSCFSDVFVHLDNACYTINEILNKIPNDKEKKNEITEEEKCGLENDKEEKIKIKEEEKCGLENVRRKIVEMLCNKHVKSKYKSLIKLKCKKLSEYDSECDLVTAWKLEDSVLKKQSFSSSEEN